MTYLEFMMLKRIEQKLDLLLKGLDDQQSVLLTYDDHYLLPPKETERLKVRERDFVKQGS